MKKISQNILISNLRNRTSMSIKFKMLSWQVFEQGFIEVPCKIVIKLAVFKHISALFEKSQFDNNHNLNHTLNLKILKLKYQDETLFEGV